VFKFPKGKDASARSQAQANAGSRFDGSSNPAQEAQRELIRVVFRDMVRIHGLPVKWLDCEIHSTLSADLNEQFQIQLIIRHWSGHLLRYAQAFEKVMKHYLDKYEPTVDHTDYEWVWRFADDCVTPFPEMPSPQEWTAKSENTKAGKALEFFERRKTPRPTQKNGKS
jgi:hypothetical protein